MTRQSFSILIIAKDRDSHLAKTIAGVNEMTELPDEVVVVYMNQPEHPDLSSGVPLKVLDLNSEHPLPLAEARNLAAASASSKILLFLDVDCIPLPSYATEMLDALEEFPGLVMGSPHYLPSGQPHPSLKDLPTGFTDDYDLFWSLCFAISKTDFDRTGGFDTSFTGYGAEDTDFAWSVRDAGIRFSHCDATVLHQHHGSYRPPLNNFDDIVDNARAFYAKWSQWPMEGWLRAFADRGHISWTPNSDFIEVFSRPTDAEVADARSESDF